MFIYEEGCLKVENRGNNSISLIGTYSHYSNFINNLCNIKEEIPFVERKV